MDAEDTPEACLARAEECRRLAEATAEEHLRARLIDLAESFEFLAKTLAEKSLH